MCRIHVTGLIVLSLLHKVLYLVKNKAAIVAIAAVAIVAWVVVEVVLGIVME